MVVEFFAASGIEFWISLYVLSAFISGGVFIALRRFWSSVPLEFSLIHFFIVVWSGLMYLNFLGPTPLTDFAWYADWMVSTPLILLALGLTAMRGRENRWDLLGGIMGLQFMLIVTGIISQESGSTYAFWVGNALLIGVLYIIWKPFREMAEETSEELGRSYRLIAAYISVLFVLYPVFWYIGSPGPLNILDSYQTSLAFIVLPVMCKQIYGFMDLYTIQRYES